MALHDDPGPVTATQAQWVPPGVHWHSPEGSSKSSESPIPHCAPANISQLRRCPLQPPDQSEHTALSTRPPEVSPTRRTCCAVPRSPQSDPTVDSVRSTSTHTKQARPKEEYQRSRVTIPPSAVAVGPTWRHHHIGMARQAVGLT